MALDPNEAAKISAINDQITELRSAIRRDISWHAEMDDLVDQVKELMETTETWEFQFGSIGAQAVELLESKHAPTLKQQTDHKADNGQQSRLTTNSETFPQALICATMTGILRPGQSEPDEPLTMDEIKVLFASDVWTTNDKVRMFWVAREADAIGTALVGDMGNG